MDSKQNKSMSDETKTNQGHCENLSVNGSHSSNNAAIAKNSQFLQTSLSHRLGVLALESQLKKRSESKVLMQIMLEMHQKFCKNLNKFFMTELGINFLERL